MDTPTRKWNTEEDRILLVMINTGRPRADIAKRFDTTEDEIALRFRTLAEQMEAAEKQAPKQDPSMPQVDGMIAAFTQVCAIYNDLGQSLIPLSEMLSSQLNEEQFLQELINCIASIRMKLPQGVPILPPMIAKELTARFVIMPRPTFTTSTATAPATGGPN